MQSKSVIAPGGHDHFFLGLDVELLMHHAARDNIIQLPFRADLQGRREQHLRRINPSHRAVAGGARVQRDAAFVDREQIGAGDFVAAAGFESEQILPFDLFWAADHDGERRSGGNRAGDLIFPLRSGRGREKRLGRGDGRDSGEEEEINPAL